MKQFREQFSVDASQCRGSELDNGPDLFYGSPSFMNRIGGDIVPGKLGECRFKMESSDHLEFLSDRFVESQMKAWVTFFCDLGGPLPWKGCFFHSLNTFWVFCRCLGKFTLYRELIPVADQEVLELPRILVIELRVIVSRKSVLVMLERRPV